MARPKMIHNPDTRRLDAARAVLSAARSTVAASGAPAMPGLDSRATRPIPAWAGETLASIPLFLKAKVLRHSCEEKIKTNWKRAIKDVIGLLSLHQQDAVSIHYFFRRLAQNLDAEIADRPCIPKN